METMFRLLSDEQSLGGWNNTCHPNRYKFHPALRFQFEATNNESEYEALLAGLRMATELKARVIQCYNDSQLVINQIIRENEALGTKMAAYLEKVKAYLGDFEFYSME